MAGSSIAHLGESLRDSGWVPVVVLAGIALAALVVHDLRVKHGRVRARELRTPVATIVVLALLALVAPVSNAQDSSGPAGLPDLISDPPFIWFTRDIVQDDGEIRRVLAFDGHLHNIGEGSLEVSGNPQIEGGMKQRVFNGQEWEDVGEPTVRFETDDGHNHFHLIQAADYELWNDARTSAIGDASKVGFCLVDSEQKEDDWESLYSIARSSYCGVDEPDTTALTMGITPGWSDLYDANTTLQWVDITNTEPGRYWVAAYTDPNNEIVESNEDNNGIVFSFNRFEVPGYQARPLPVQKPSEPIVLKANVYGTTGTLAFVVTEGPSNGSLSVPVGADLLTNEVVYRPDSGFEGQDTFSYSAHNLSDPFPRSPLVVQVVINVDGQSDSGEVDEDEVDEDEVDEADTAGDQDSESGDSDAIANIDLQTAAVHDRVTLQVAVTEPEPVAWYAADLPPGLHMNPETGEISGVVGYAGSYESTVIAQIAGEFVRQQVVWTVAPTEESPSLQQLGDVSSPSTGPARIMLGSSRDGAIYESVGELPEGATANSSRAFLGGRPAEVGAFEVEITETVDGEIVGRTEFTWTIRASTKPEFPL